MAHGISFQLVSCSNRSVGDIAFCLAMLSF